MSPAGALQGTTNLGDFKDPRSRCHMSHPMTTAVTQQRPCASHVLLSYASYRFIATGAEMTGEKARPSLPPQVLRTPESCQKISAKAPSMITTANAPVCPPVWGTKMEKHLSLSGSQWVSEVGKWTVQFWTKNHQRRFTLRLTWQLRLRRQGNSQDHAMALVPTSTAILLGATARVCGASNSCLDFLLFLVRDSCNFHRNRMKSVCWGDQAP